MKLRVLLVEDDHIQRQNARQAIENAIEAEVETKSTEWEFQRDFEAIAANPPHVAVLDIMLRWANPAADMPSAPTDVTSSSEAGLRCARRLLSDERTRDVKVLLYSVLAKDDLGERPPEGADCVIKEVDFENLIERIRGARAGLRLVPPAVRKN